MVVIGWKTVTFDQLVALCVLEILADHFTDQLGEADAWPPAKIVRCLRTVAKQGINFGRAEIAPNRYARCFARFDRYRPRRFPSLASEFSVQFLGRGVYEFAHTVLFASRDHIIFGLILLQHQPLHLHLVARMSPVALCIQVADVPGSPAGLV